MCLVLDVVTGFDALMKVLMIVDLRLVGSQR